MADEKTCHIDLTTFTRHIAQIIKVYKKKPGRIIITQKIIKLLCVIDTNKSK